MMCLLFILDKLIKRSVAGNTRQRMKL